METENKTVFADGFIFKKPNEKAPDFIKGNISIKVDEFKKFLDANVNDGWVNLDLKVSKGGKLYVALNNWTAKEAFKSSLTPEEAKAIETAKEADKKAANEWFDNVGQDVAF